jgi:hypothetical protein
MIEFFKHIQNIDGNRNFVVVDKEIYEDRGRIYLKAAIDYLEQKALLESTKVAYLSLFSCHGSENLGKD